MPDRSPLAAMGGPCNDAAVVNGPPNPGQEAIASSVRRAAEIELDVLVAHELASGGPAAAAIWRACNFEVPTELVTVVRQEPRDDGRTSDVVASANGATIHCEDKAAGGQFEDGQPESYAAHVQRHRDCEAVLIAPRSLIDSGAASRWTRVIVTVETLCAALDDAIRRRVLDAELRRSYQWRAETLSRYAQAPGYQLVVDPEQVVFADQYRTLARELTDGTVQILKTSLQGKRSGFATYVLPQEDLSLKHKLRAGVLDLRPGRWTLRRLRQWVDHLPAEHAPPSGWEVALQQDGGKSSRTGEPVPVLRWQVPVITLLKPFDDIREDLVRTIMVASAVRTWLDAGAGTVLATGGGAAAVDAELRCARLAAELVEDPREGAIRSLLEQSTWPS